MYNYYYYYYYLLSDVFLLLNTTSFTNSSCYTQASMSAYKSLTAYRPISFTCKIEQKCFFCLCLIFVLFILCLIKIKQTKKYVYIDSQSTFLSKLKVVSCYYQNLSPASSSLSGIKVYLLLLLCINQCLNHFGLTSSLLQNEYMGDKCCF